MPKPKPLRPPFNYDRLCTVDEGIRMEISVEVDNLIHPVLQLVADEEDESLWVEVYIGEQPVQIPLAYVRSRIVDGPNAVCSEARWNREHPEQEQEQE